MKKRGILFTLLLAMMILVTACGSGQKSVEGKWVGSLDLTKQFEDGIKTAHPDLKKYVDFDDLTFKMDIAFVNGKMSLDIQEESVADFNANFKVGMQNIAVGYWKAGLKQIDMTWEEAISESGKTETEYLEHIYSETGIDKIIESMTDVTNKTLEKLSGLKGTYTTPVEKELRLYYTDDKYESMEYGFKGKNLNITIKGDSFSLLIKCEKNSRAKEEKGNPFLGTWSGNLDYTKCFTDMMAAENADIEKFVKFENLNFTFVFAFTEEKVSVHIDEASKQQFISNVEKGVAGMIDAMAAEEAKKNGITVEKVYDGMGVTRDAYVKQTMDHMKIDVMVNTMAAALELNGAYQYDDKQIVVLYDDNTYEEMSYAFGIEDLIITISDGTNSFAIPCTKTK